MPQPVAIPHPGAANNTEARVAAFNTAMENARECLNEAVSAPFGSYIQQTYAIAAGAYVEYARALREATLGTPPL